ncbi:hypothetical protein ACFWPH_28500 [Nocardia sp. NPDC058499]|uniref:hypothetical protein n=1 Tax=Nocardia sp. NPDC058499 TaxID=3346530 RepID=UPI003661D1DB
MGSNRGPNRHTARKNDARALATRTGMPYQAALRQVTQNNERREPRHRWLLTDDVRAWFAGEGWRGVGYPNLYDWLDAIRPTYDCDWCGEPGDARTVDSSIVLLVTAYDPDLSPTTAHIGTRTHHAACQPSAIQWLQRADIPSGPQAIALPASAKPEVVGEFELTTRAVLTTGHNDEDGDWDQAMLLITARVIDDHNLGARPWMSELELSMRAAGFGHADSVLSTRETDWTLRIVTDHPSTLAPQWIALRTGRPEGGTPDHLVLCALDLPAAWVAAARRDGRVAVVIGPCTAHWDFTDVPGELVYELDDRIDEPGPDAHCGCAALTAEHVSDLLDEGAYVVGLVEVAPEEAVP